MRDHKPIVIEEFNGWFARGDADSVPLDHFAETNNIAYIQSGFRTRDGLQTFAAVANPLRMYTYNQSTGPSLLILNNAGSIYHYIPSTATLNGPILTIVGMTDFAFVNINGYAYISPHNGITGLASEYLYVYLGAGVAARRAAGTKPGSGMTATNSGTAGVVETGLHYFGVAFETDTGFITKLATAYPSVTADGTKKVDLASIPTGGSSVVGRYLFATKAILPPIDSHIDPADYEYFFIPGGHISDNSTTSLSVDFYDSDLIRSANYLLDAFETIAAGIFLTTYHNSLVIGGEYANPTVVRVSKAGEWESINEIDGLMITERDGNPLTNAHEYRDVLYVFKSTKTFAFTDNGDVPSSWPQLALDQGIGATCHGICTILDSGGINVDFLMMLTYSGVLLFNGAYVRPEAELSWKIRAFWLSLFNDNNWRNYQIYNDSINQIIYISLPPSYILIGDYGNELTPGKIRWGKWTFDVEPTTISIIDNNKLLIGSKQFAA